MGLYSTSNNRIVDVYYIILYNYIYNEYTVIQSHLRLFHYFRLFSSSYTIHIISYHMYVNVYHLIY